MSLKMCIRDRLRRDMEKTLTDIVNNRNRIILCKKDLKPEQYELEVTEQEITIYGADARSFIYALNYLSETYLGVLPFWFWNDQKMEVKSYVEIPCGTYHSEADRIRYRGWFINDEVLISHWTAGVSKDYPWEMVFEADVYKRQAVGLFKSLVGCVLVLICNWASKKTRGRGIV